MMVIEIDVIKKIICINLEKQNKSYTFTRKLEENSTAFLWELGLDQIE